MSSASSGRYQSKLFNFIHRQSRRLTERYNRALGHLRVTSSWLGVGLYPLYLLFESTSSVAKQLHQAVQQLPQLPVGNTNVVYPPTTDTPIQRVLLAVDTLPSEEAFLSSPEQTQFVSLVSKTLRWFKFLPNSSKDSSSLTHPCSTLSSNHSDIQGIATQLSSRSLVLITSQNKILDIFTFQQQQKLQGQIIREVAAYWSSQRLHSVNQQLTAQLANSGKLLLPVSLNSTIAKVQTGLTALIGNTFQKSSLVKRQEAEVSYAHRALIFLDSTVAGLESQQLAPVSVAITLRQRSWKLVELVQTKVSGYLFAKPQPSDDKTPASAKFNKANNLTPEVNPRRIQSLILAAINYFFGVSGTKPRVTTTATTTSPKLAASSTQVKALPHRRTLNLPASSQLVSADGDPWLTLDDLFGESLADEPSTFYKPESSVSKTSGVTDKTIRIPSSQLNRYSLQNLIHRFQRALAGTKQSEARLEPKNTIGKVGDVESKQIPPLPKSAPGIDADKIANYARSQEPIPQPDWIETDATAIGYVKHPLEQLLGWLDRVLLWMEEMVLKALHWLQRLWQGK